MLYIFISLIIVLATIGIITIYYYNKFQFTIIKINEAENNIDILLEKKLEYFNRIVPLIKEKVKDENILEDAQKLKVKKLDHFALRDALQKLSIELNEVLDSNQEVEEVENIKNILEDMIDNNIDLDAAIKYYNDNVVTFNKLVRCFPSNILKVFWHYKTKEFYSNEKEEIFEILKK